MDVNEAVRAEAERIHAKAVAAGVDPRDPLALVEAAVIASDIDLSWLAPGDVYLRGGRGLYDPELLAIACEAAGDRGTRALLAGHELGHAVLHDPGEAIVDRHMDPTRSPETAASGVETVVDYGRRERREVQADLFARELVLPRPLARRMFVDGAGARQIADLMGLPYALVAQQLCDVLLLPPAEVRPPSRAAGPSPILDASQSRAADHSGSPFLLQAGPGTGKTRTLVSRLERLLDGGVPAADILVLTFSNKAAGELVERLSASRPEAAPAMWIGTFHGFGLDVLRQFHDREGLPDDPRLIDRADAVGLLEDLVPRLPVRHYRNLYDPTLELGEILGAISRAKDELASPERYMELARAMADRAATTGDDDARIRAEKAIEVAEVYAVYDAEMRRAGWVDFGDLVMRPALLLERDPEALAILRRKHAHILVDEYQDVNRSSVRLLKALAGAGERLWVVGDSRQSIYRFRGASSANVAGFQGDFPAGRLDRLDTNYRSTAEVVSTFSGFSTGMLASAGVLPLDLAAKAGPSGRRPELRRVGHPDDEAAAVAARIHELRDGGLAFRDQAVLCRGNVRLGDIAAALERRDIPVLFLGNLFEREEVRDLLALLSLLVDPRAGCLPRIAAMPRYAMGLADVAIVAGMLRRSETPLAWIPAAMDRVGPAAAAGLARLAADLDGFGGDSHPWQAICHLVLDRRCLPDGFLTSTQTRDRMRRVAVWQLMAFCRDLPRGAGLPIQRLLDRSRRLVLLAEERDLRQMPAAAAAMDGVHLMTVHGSKGLEFEAVHVPGMVSRGFPGDNRTPRCPPPDGLVAGSEGMTGLEAVKAGHAEEEECLFFVAMSRARRDLMLYGASQTVNGSNRGPSPYLERLAGDVLVVPNPPLLLPSREDPEAGRIAVEWMAGPAFSAEQISLYAKCPRRFFYTHVLGASGGRRATPFMQMHDVVYDLLRWLREDARRWALASAEVIARFDEVWARKGPIEHGYADDYRRAGLDLVEALMRSRSGHLPGARDPVRIAVDGLHVVVEPDEVRGSGPGTTFRRVRTGRKAAKEEDDIVYALYLMAAASRHGSGAGVEAIHLSEGTATPISLSVKKLANREATVRSIASRIIAGYFPYDPDDRTCPRCPHYVTCGPLPAGPLRLG